LTIRDGRAVGPTYNGKGGGLLAYHAGKKFLPREDAIGFKMTLQNCRFEQNEALEGGAIYAYGRPASQFRTLPSREIGQLMAGPT